MDEADKARRSWDKLLNPQTLRTNLLLASLYLTAYELLRETIVGRIRRFFTYEFIGEDGSTIVDEQYREVKKLNRNLLLASCLWLEQNDATSSEDAASLQSIRRHRNQIAHELPHFLGDIDREINLEYLQ